MFFPKCSSAFIFFSVVIITVNNVSSQFRPSVLNSSFINSGIVRGIGTVVSRVTTPIRGAAGGLISRFGGALPGRAGQVGE